MSSSGIVRQCEDGIIGQPVHNALVPGAPRGRKRPRRNDVTNSSGTGSTKPSSSTTAAEDRLLLAEFESAAPMAAEDKLSPSAKRKRRRRLVGKQMPQHVPDLENFLNAHVTPQFSQPSEDSRHPEVLPERVPPVVGA